MIETRELNFAYRGSAKPAVEDLSFSVPPGSVFGFLGPSGAGKSTTQRILVGLARGYRGSALVLGREARDWGRELYARIGVAFEVPAFHAALSARENLAYFAAHYPALGRREARREAEALLERLGLAADGDKRVGAFSKGMKARLNLARALLHRPDLLFLDEPTSGLDPANARVAADLVRERARAGAAVFLTTHSMELAETLCDRVGFLCDGRMATQGSPRELRIGHGRRQVAAEFRDGDGLLRRREFALEGLADEGDFLGLLRAGRLETLHSQEASLAEVFLATTGRGLE